MSAASPLETQVAELERQTARLKSALSRGVWITRLLLLAALAFVGAVGYVLWREVAKFQKPEVQEQLLGLVGDAYRKDEKLIHDNLDKLRAAVQPLATKAVEDQWKLDQPKFAKKLEEQGAEFQQRIQKQAEEKLKALYANAMGDLKDVLRKEVPELAKDEAKLQKVQEALLAAAYTMVEKRGTEKLKKGFHAVGENWAKLPAAPKRKAGDMDTHMQLLGHALEIFYQVGTQPDAIAKLSDAASTPPALLRPVAPPKPPAPKPAPPKEAAKEAPKAEAPKAAK